MSFSPPSRRPSQRMEGRGPYGDSVGRNERREPRSRSVTPPGSRRSYYGHDRSRYLPLNSPGFPRSMNDSHKRSPRSPRDQWGSWNGHAASQSNVRENRPDSRPRTQSEAEEREERNRYMLDISDRWGAGVLRTFGWHKNSTALLKAAAQLSSMVPSWPDARKKLNNSAWVRCVMAAAEDANAEAPTTWQCSDFERLVERSNARDYGNMAVNFYKEADFDIGLHGELIRRRRNPSQSQPNASASPTPWSATHHMDTDHGAFNSIASSLDGALDARPDAKASAHWVGPGPSGTLGVRRGSFLPSHALGGSHAAGRPSSKSGQDGLAVSNTPNDTSADVPSLNRQQALATVRASWRRDLDGMTPAERRYMLEAFFQETMDDSLVQDSTRERSTSLRHASTSFPGTEVQSPSRPPSNQADFDWSKVPKGPKEPQRVPPESVGRVPHIFVSSVDIPSDRPSERRLEWLIAQWGPTIYRKTEGYYIVFKTNASRDATKSLADLMDCYQKCNGTTLYKDYILQMEPVMHRYGRSRQASDHNPSFQTPEMREPNTPLQRVFDRDTTAHNLLHSPLDSAFPEAARRHSGLAADEEPSLASRPSSGVAHRNSDRHLSHQQEYASKQPVGGGESPELRSKDDHTSSLPPWMDSTDRSSTPHTWSSGKRLSTKFSRAPPSPPRHDLATKSNGQDEAIPDESSTAGAAQTPANRPTLLKLSRTDLRHLVGLRQKADDEISISSSAALSDISSRSSRKEPFCRKCPKETASNSPLHNPLVGCSTCHRHYHHGCSEPPIARDSDRSDWRCSKCVRRSRLPERRTSIPSLLSDRHRRTSATSVTAPAPPQNTNGSSQRDQEHPEVDSMTDTGVLFTDGAASSKSQREQTIASQPLPRPTETAMDDSDSDVEMEVDMETDTEMAMDIDSPVDGPPEPLTVSRVKEEDTESTHGAASASADVVSHTEPGTGRESLEKDKSIIPLTVTHSSPATKNSADLPTKRQLPNDETEPSPVEDSEQPLGHGTERRDTDDAVRDAAASPASPRTTRPISSPTNKSPGSVAFQSPTVSREQAHDAGEEQSRSRSDKAQEHTANPLLERRKYVLRELAGMAIINTPGWHASSRTIIDWVKKNVPGYSDDDRPWQAEIGALKWAQNISAILAGTTKSFKVAVERSGSGLVEYTFVPGGENAFLKFKQWGDWNDDADGDDHIRIEPTDETTPKKGSAYGRRTTGTAVDSPNARARLHAGRTGDSTGSPHAGSSKTKGAGLGLGKIKPLRKSAAKFSRNSSRSMMPTLDPDTIEDQIDVINVGPPQAQGRGRVVDSSPDSDSESESEALASRKYQQSRRLRGTGRNARTKEQPSATKTGYTSEDDYPDWWHQMRINRVEPAPRKPQPDPKWYTDMLKDKARGVGEHLDDEDFVVKDFFEEWSEYRAEHAFEESMDIAAKLREISARPSRKQTMHDNIASRKALNREKETGSIHRLVLPMRPTPVINENVSKGLTPEDVARKARHEAFIREGNNKWFPEGWVEVQTTEELHGLPDDILVQLSAMNGELGHMYAFHANGSDEQPTVEFIALER